MFLFMFSFIGLRGGIKVKPSAAHHSDVRPQEGEQSVFNYF